jgi:GTPase involved in cell partitioning and DNA repair
LEYAKEGLTLAKEIEALDREKDAYEILTEIYTNLKNYKKALEYKDKWIAVNDSMFNADKAKALAEMASRYDYEKKLAIDSVETAKNYN